MISIVLDKQNIICEKICADIQRLISKHAQENGVLKNSVLTISIAKISEGSIKQEVLNIEHKQEQNG